MSSHMLPADRELYLCGFVALESLQLLRTLIDFHIILPLDIQREPG
jgi:hypothetical protein